MQKYSVKFNIKQNVQCYHILAKLAYDTQHVDNTLTPLSIFEPKLDPDLVFWIIILELWKFKFIEKVARCILKLTVKQLRIFFTQEKKIREKYSLIAFT